MIWCDGYGVDDEDLIQRISKKIKIDTMSVFPKEHKVYILQKDLPDADKGDWYSLIEEMKAYYRFGNPEGSYWLSAHVENNSDWFLPKEDRVGQKTDGLQKAKDVLFDNGYSLLKNGILEMRFKGLNYSEFELETVR